MVLQKQLHNEPLSLPGRERFSRNHSRIEPMNPVHRTIPLSSTHLWKRGMGGGGSFLGGGFMERLPRNYLCIEPMNPLCAFHLPLLHILVEERDGGRRLLFSVERFMGKVAEGRERGSL
jgi:hypothetical protein